ncbi:MAG: glycosyl hydrolase family 2, partial [Duncaniella sp.]|nr:glycosyl hydrolase family 2 [Duncaniella sp.]
LYIDRIRLTTRDLTDNWEVKSGLRTEVTYPRAIGGEHGAIDLSEVRDLTAGLGADGHLTATLPEGRWHIIRMGHQPTGARTKHGRANLLGPEADVMSARAAETHYRNYFKAIHDTLAAQGTPPAGMCMDSHEAGIANWTPGFEARFEASAGYPVTPWIPALAGYIIGTREETDDFLRDFCRAISETIATEFYGTLARLCREDGVDFTSQAMLNIANDNLLSRSVASKPQGEFWAYQTDGNYDVLDAASAAHLYGHPIASGEAFTDTPYGTPWDELMRIADLAYCRGINEFAVCASSYQPDLMARYDDSASAHPYIFHRLNPDWESSRAFWDAQARSTWMMRHGRPSVDLLVYIGEEYPVKTMAYRLPEMPQGFNFDVCNRDALLGHLSVADGAIEAEGGMRYKAIIVQGRTHISTE